MTVSITNASPVSYEASLIVERFQKSHVVNEFFGHEVRSAIVTYHATSLWPISQPSFGIVSNFWFKC